MFCEKGISLKTNKPVCTGNSCMKSQTKLYISPQNRVSYGSVHVLWKWYKVSDRTKVMNKLQAYPHFLQTVLGSDRAPSTNRTVHILTPALPFKQTVHITYIWHFLKETAYPHMVHNPYFWTKQERGNNMAFILMSLVIKFCRSLCQNTLLKCGTFSNLMYWFC